MASQDFPIDILDFLKRAALGEGRIVSSGDLTTLQIAEAQAVPGRFYVDPATSLGWAILPWHLRCPKDKEREDARITLPASSSPSSKQEDDRANAAKDLVAEEEIRRRSIRPGDVTLSVRRHGEGVTADIWPLPDQIHDTTVREFIELLIGIAQRIEILPTGVFVRPDHPATTPPDSNPPAKSEEPTKPTQSVQPWPEDLSVLVGRKIVLRSKKYGDRRPGFVDRIFCVEDGSCIHFAHGVGWMAGDHDLLSVSPPLEAKPQSVQSEGKVRWFKHKTDKNMVWESVGRYGRWHHLDGSIEESGLGIEGFTTDENYEEFFPTQPKDSKEMGGHSLIQQWMKDCDRIMHEPDRVELVARINAALKSANERADLNERSYKDMRIKCRAEKERAEAAEKKLECARVNGFLDSMAD